MQTENRKQEILLYIVNYIAENGYDPSYREIGRATGLRSTSSVAYYINKLRDEGHLKNFGRRNTRKTDEEMLRYTGTILRSDVASLALIKK